MPAHLLLQEEDETSAFPLDKPIMVLGRADDCDLILRQTMKLSRRHCCIAQVNGKLVIRDLGSMNGLKVNDTRVIEKELKEGDQILLGDLHFTFTLKPPPKNSSTPPKGVGKSGKVAARKNRESDGVDAEVIRDDNDRAREADRETPRKPSGARPKKKTRQEEEVELLDSGDLDVGGLGEV